MLRLRHRATHAKRLVVLTLTLTGLMSLVVPPTSSWSRPVRIASVEKEDSANQSVRPSSVSAMASSDGRQITPQATNFWSTHGPGGGDVICLAIDPSNPSVIYVGPNSNGVFKSIDGGASWSAVNNGLSSPSTVNALAIDPTNSSTVYAGTNSNFGASGDVYKSTNGGASWSKVNNGLPGYIVYALAIAPSNSSTVYAVIAGSGVYKTTDEGASWSASGLLGTGINVLAIDPTNSSTIYAGTFGGVVKSTDGGTNWTTVNNGLPDSPDISALAIDPTNSNTLYAGTYRGVYKSTDGGSSWSASNNGLPSRSVFALTIDRTNSNVLYVGIDGTADFFGNSPGSVYKTIDGGVSWSASSNGLTATRVSALAIDPTNPNKVYAGGFGVFKSIDGGENWNGSNNGLSATRVSGLAVDPTNSNTVYAGIIGSGVYKSTNAGASWSASGLPDAGLLGLVIDPTDSNTVYAGGVLAIDPTNANTLYASGGSVFKSTNGGASWSPANNGLDLPATLHKSTNGGANWSPSGNGLSCGPLAFAIEPTNANNLYAGTYCGGIGVFKSTNGGASWSASTNGLPDTSINALAIDPVNPNIVYAGAFGFSSVYKSTNGGASWSASNNGLPSVPVRALVIDPINSSTLYAGTIFGGVFKSANGGASWSGFNDGLTNFAEGDYIFINKLAIDSSGTSLHAGTASSGVFDYQYGTNCTYTIAPTSQSFPLSGGSNSVAVSATSGCGWTAMSNASWITVTAGRSGIGNGTINYTVESNPISSQRTGTITIAGQAFTVNQGPIYPGIVVDQFQLNGSEINFAIHVSNSVGQTFTVGQNGILHAIELSLFAQGSGGDLKIEILDLTGGADLSLAPILGSVSIPATGLSLSLATTLDLNTVTATVIDVSSLAIAVIEGDRLAFRLTTQRTLPNLYGIRTARLSDLYSGGVLLINNNPVVGGDAAFKTFVGTACTYTITPTIQSFPTNGGSGSVAVTATNGCNWTARSNASFITITTGTSGTGNGTVNYSVSVNTDHVRTGTLTIAGRTFTLTQAAAPKNGKTAGVFRPSNGIIYLKNSNTSGFADIFLIYGNAGDVPVAGDWNGDGVDTMGIYRDGVFYLRNSNSTGFADLVIPFGNPGDQPIVGDWNGDGIDTIGIYRNGLFFLSNSNTTGPPDLSFILGDPGDIPIAGDWNGDGIVTTGVFRPTNGIVYLKNTNTTGFSDIDLIFGNAGDKPVAGDWDGDGIDTVGIYRGDTFYLRNTNTTGFANLVFVLGNSGDVPIVGDWDGLP